MLNAQESMPSEKSYSIRCIVLCLRKRIVLWQYFSAIHCAHFENLQVTNRPEYCTSLGWICCTGYHSINHDLYSFVRKTDHSFDCIGIKCFYYLRYQL